jgi:hypothetical protein
MELKVPAALRQELLVYKQFNSYIDEFHQLLQNPGAT